MEFFQLRICMLFWTHTKSGIGRTLQAVSLHALSFICNFLVLPIALIVKTLLELFAKLYETCCSLACKTSVAINLLTYLSVWHPYYTKIRFSGTHAVFFAELWWGTWAEHRSLLLRSWTFASPCAPLHVTHSHSKVFVLGEDIVYCLDLLNEANSLVCHSYHWCLLLSLLNLIMLFGWVLIFTHLEGKIKWL